MSDVVSAPPAAACERRLFLWLSLAIAATAAIGFGRGFVLGRAHAGALPLQVHVHAALFGGWLLLYVVQNALVDVGSLALHRRLGWLGAGLAAVMVPFGIAVTALCVQRGAVPGFFPPPIFLALNVLGLLVFGGLVAAGIALRRRPDWHRRLMACGAIVLMSPALGRLLPMPAFGALAPLAITASILAFVAAGMAFDLALRRRVHRAWWTGAAAVVALQLAVGPVAFSPPVRTLAERLAATARPPAAAERNLDR